MSTFCARIHGGRKGRSLDKSGTYYHDTAHARCKKCNALNRYKHIDRLASTCYTITSITTIDGYFHVVSELEGSQVRISRQSWLYSPTLSSAIIVYVMKDSSLREMPCPYGKPV